MEALIAHDDGHVELRLSDIEAQVVRQVALDIGERLREPDGDDITRLFPPAYPDDDAFEEEFTAMTRDDLVEHKMRAARAVADSIDAGKSKRGTWTGLLGIEAIHAWVGVLNDARLILGTRLDVREDTEHEPLTPDHPDAHAFNVYLYLGGMQELLVHHLLEHDLDT